MKIPQASLRDFISKNKKIFSPPFRAGKLLPLKQEILFTNNNSRKKEFKFKLNGEAALYKIAKRSYPRIAFKSSSGVCIGPRLNFSTSTLRMLGVIKAGSDGPSRISLIPK